MSERNQDQRPVYMGTFSKYTRAFESRVAVTENEIADIDKKIKFYSKKVDRLKVLVKVAGIITVAAFISELAILLLTFL
jgi:hypothetical protein